MIPNVVFRKVSVGGRKGSVLIRAPASLKEQAVCSQPSMVAHKPSEPQFRGSHTLFWPVWALHACVAQTCMQTRHPYK